MGAPKWSPNPYARRAPAEPWRASMIVAGDGGPDMAPKPPYARRAPAEPWRASISVAGSGGPEMAPNPPSLGALRRSRGAPRSASQVVRARDGPQTPIARRAPAEPWRASMIVAGDGGPEMVPKPLCSARSGGAVARLDDRRR